MTDEEKNLLLEIDSLYKELLRETNGYNYYLNAKELEAKVNELFNNYKPSYLDFESVKALQHSID